MAQNLEGLTHLMIMGQTLFVLSSVSRGSPFSLFHRDLVLLYRITGFHVHLRIVEVIVQCVVCSEVDHHIEVLPIVRDPSVGGGLGMPRAYGDIFYKEGFPKLFCKETIDIDALRVRAEPVAVETCIFIYLT